MSRYSVRKPHMLPQIRRRKKITCSLSEKNGRSGHCFRKFIEQVIFFQDLTFQQHTKTARRSLFGTAPFTIPGLLILSLLVSGCTGGAIPASPVLPSDSSAAVVSPSSLPDEETTLPTDTATVPAATSTPTPSPKPAKPPRPEMSATPEPVRTDTRLPFSRGVNLGNCLEAPLEGAWGLVVQDEWMATIRSAGFDHIRLPVRWTAYAGIKAPYAVDERFLARVDHIIDTALNADLGVVLNVHHYAEMATDPEAHIDRLAGIWILLADHFKDLPETVAFELMNEPNGAADAVWPDMSARLYDVVRKTDADRWICITNGSWSAAGKLATLKVPDKIQQDNRVFATFHFYEPFQFTHQNANWVAGSDAWAGTKWDGTKDQQAFITSLYDGVSKWAEMNGNLPVLMGEFGAYAACDPLSRIRWTEFCAREAERRGFAWSYWEFASGFGIYGKNSKKYDVPLLKALIPDTAVQENK